MVAIGQHVGHYRLTELIGRGGMGVVYRGRDVVLDRDVALKTVLPTIVLNTHLRKRLMREARTASKLAHPAIVPVFEVFEADGIPWIVMQLVEGITLAHHLREHGPMPLEQTVEHQAALAGALNAAHKKGMIHRDIKPSNILVSRDGTVQLTDFGLARPLAASSDSDSTGATDTLTDDGAVVGTLPYMSPEQALGRPLDGRSDIFSLGAVLFEMITGRRAFEASSDGALIEGILHRNPPALVHPSGDVPEDLQRIIGRCLEKQPENRYQHAGDLESDLRAVGRRSGSWDSTAPRRSSIGKRFLRPALIVTVGLALIGLAVNGQRWLAGRSAQVPPHTARQLTDLAELESDPAISPTGHEIAYSVMDRGNTDIWIIDRLGGSPLRLTSREANDSHPCWYPDGSAVAFVSDRTGRDAVWRVPRLGGPKELVLEDARDPDISPDGTRIAFARVDTDGFQRVFVADLDRPGGVRRITGPDDGLWDHQRPAWSPDGSLICYHAFRNLWLIDPDDGPARPLTNDDPPDWEPAWAPDGRHVYFTSFRNGAWAIWKTSISGSSLERVTTGTGSERAPHVSLDGGLLAYATQSEITSLEVVDRGAGKRSRLHAARDMSQPAISPDGRSVVFYSTFENKLDLWHSELDGIEPVGEPMRLTRLEGTASNPRFSPNGQWIAFYRVLDGRRDLWAVPSGGGTPLQLTDDPAVDILPEFSPDGQTIAFSSDRSGSLQIWVLGFDVGEVVAAPIQITDVSGSAIRPTWSPDGHEVAFIHSSADVSDVWIVPVQGDAPPRQLTEGARALFLRWARQSDELLVSGFWDLDRPTIRRVDPKTRETVDLEGLTPTDPAAELSIFDVSQDGRLVIMKSIELRGDVWELEAERRPF